ncbi:alpha/beta fold hydrolase [Cloacibacterium sp. TD35]|uniref:alpha/beta fold hydrolase n=1 Tax=Cloacibacterium sp. TD35 TaxID=2976818 RepID=UPI00237E1DDA|nr:alpha/beta hydrolase [Cloacibacterium sp. TD35]WDT67392.1 alpha/beta hydrolase [Cloacibacterium sp. TD35]
MINTIYIISGLGADKRMFQNFTFEGFEVVHIDWILPLENETLQSYALRISENIKDENAILIGLSFGGILSVEISKIKKFKKIFLLSSAKTKFEIPFYYRLIGKLNILKILPNSILKRVNSLTYLVFGAKTNDEKSLLKDIVRNTDERFLKWALHQIMNWKNEDYSENIIHIQGDSDLILPHIFVKYDYLLKGGTHFMTLNQSKEIETIIIENLL